MTDIQFYAVTNLNLTFFALLIAIFCTLESHIYGLKTETSHMIHMISWLLLNLYTVKLRAGIESDMKDEIG